MARGSGRSRSGGLFTPGENAGLMATSAMSGAGSGVICLPGDSSVVCQVKKTVGTVQGVMYLLFVLFLVWYVWNNRKQIFGK